MTVDPPAGPPAPEPRGGHRPGGPRRVPRYRRVLNRRLFATLPARLRLLRAAVLAVAAALVVLLAVAGFTAHGTWAGIAGRDAPRTTSAADLDLALDDMDAQVANILLASGDAGAGRLQTPYAKAVGFYGDSRTSISRALRTLAVAAEGDPAAQHTVESLIADYARYQELVGRALDSDERKGGKQAAVLDYRRATDLLQSQLLPEARELTDANNMAFEHAYRDARNAHTGQLVAALVLGVLLLAVLAALQWYLTRRFRRILNPGLLAATACALLAAVLGAQALAADAAHLRVARRDSFDSVVALSRARALAHDANADESRYLLDTDRRTGYQQAFFEKAGLLYGVEGTSDGRYPDDVARTWSAYRADHDDLRFTGEFRRELDNITFAGERDAAAATVDAYLVYVRDDAKIRRLSAAGRDREAAEFCMGWEPGTSNAHFQEWMKALDKVEAINQRHFDSSVSAGRAETTGALPRSVGSLLAAAALTVLGLRPRLREFS
ncbi:hypothetical protein AB0J38_30140 [Streptomyces sp. NPDC050095]|uniref:hypothetical protein n=1 Tax=unclassified Streptomyces TaxID=2593676 RepID=UPI00343686FE